MGGFQRAIEFQQCCKRSYHQSATPDCSYFRCRACGWWESGEYRTRSWIPNQVGWAGGVMFISFNSLSVSWNRSDDRRPRPFGSITFMTTGILLQMCKHPESIQHVSHIIVDELAGGAFHLASSYLHSRVHERDLNSDFLLTVLKDVLNNKTIRVCTVWYSSYFRLSSCLPLWTLKPFPSTSTIVQQWKFPVEPSQVCWLRN